MPMGYDVDVVDLPPADHPVAGDRAPEFTRPLANGEYWEDRSLSSLASDGPVLLAFHPMDGAFPAIYFWREVRDRGWRDFDVILAGVSISTPYEHTAFLREWDAGQVLFSDPANGVSEAYGVTHDLDGMAGVVEARPAVFVLDSDLTVRYAWAATEWPEFPDYDEVEATLEAL